MNPKPCLRARQVDILIRPGKRGEKVIYASVVCPSTWSKSTFLRYCREVHVDDAIRIVKWHRLGGQGDSWGQRLWLANPLGFVDYVRGT